MRAESTFIFIQHCMCAPQLPACLIKQQATFIHRPADTAAAPCAVAARAAPAPDVPRTAAAAGTAASTHHHRVGRRWVRLHVVALTSLTSAICSTYACLVTPVSGNCEPLYESLGTTPGLWRFGNEWDSGNFGVKFVGF